MKGVAGCLVLCLCLASPLSAQQDTAASGAAAPAAGRATASGFGGLTAGFALLAYDPGTRQLGAVVASSRPSSGSGLAFVETGSGAVAVLGSVAASAGRRALASLRRGDAAREAAGEAAAATPGATVAALTPACASASSGGPGTPSWSGSREGRDGQICYLAVGAGLPGADWIGALASGFEGESGDLLQKLLAALDAADSAGDGAPLARSAALWISTPDGMPAPLGRAELHLQADDQTRPALWLHHLADVLHADQLAQQAGSAVDAGDYDAALRRTDQAIQLDPSAPYVWLQRGRALLYAGRRQDAEQALERMMELDPHLLRLLGDPATYRTRPGILPASPRLLQRLDLYRRAYFPDTDFGPPPDSSSSSAP